MFSNIYYDARHSRVHLWEYLDKKRVHTTHDIKHEYYIIDETNQSPVQDIYGRSMLLRETDSKKNITALKSTGVYTCEGDLSEDVKFLQKRYKEPLQLESEHFNVGYIDIEISSSDSFPKPEEALFPINLITLKLSKTGESYTFGIYDYSGDVVKNYCYCSTEELMLTRFISFFRKNKIDVLTGWNVNYVYMVTDGFDVPYILNRCKNLGVDYTPLSPINIVEQKRNGGWFIAGVSILDYMSLYKNFEQENKESYSLDYITNYELGEGKLSYDGTINTLWKTDWNKFVDYNHRDVELVELLDKKLQYMSLAYQFAYDALVPFEKVFSSIALVQGHILKELHAQNKVLPDRGENEHSEYPGAYVFAKAGAYDNVMSFDVESLYPHLIMAFNISPENLILHNETERIERLRADGKLITTPVGMESGFLYGGSVHKYDHVYYDGSKDGILPTVVKKIFNERKKHKLISKYHAIGCIVNKKTNEMIKDGDYETINSNTVNKKTGEILNLNDFDVYKKDNALKMLHDRLQYCRKILVNSAYGVIATPHFALYNIKNAMAITLAGQDLIQFLSSNGGKYLMSVGFRKYKAVLDPLILVDTDSSYYCLDELFKNTKYENETFLEWSYAIEKELFAPLWKKLIKIYAEKYNIEPIINFVRDLINSKFLIFAKKKYAYEILDKEGITYAVPKIGWRGVEILRKDTPSFCRDKLEHVMKLIFSTNNKEDVIAYMIKTKKEFNKESVTNIAMPKGISDYEKYAETDDVYSKNGLSYSNKCPMHTRAAINYNYMNIMYKWNCVPVFSGTKMKYIHVLPNNVIHQDVIGFVGQVPSEFSKYFKIDYERQWERTFQNITQRFFDVLGWGEINLTNTNLNLCMEF